MGMLTPRLEKLIVEGKASFKTFTAGGSASQTLQVGNDRYIIIIGFTHFPFVATEDPANIEFFAESLITQMRVASDKTINSFVFRNNMHVSIALDESGALNNVITGGSPTSIDTYLIHEDDVTFIFSKGNAPQTNAVDIKPSKSPAKRPQTGYGRKGIQTAIGNIPVETSKDVFGAEFRPLGRITPPTSAESYTEFQFPIVNGVSNLTPAETDIFTGFPLVLVQYVEILGNPNNLQSNL
jgi:hypothetical protein